MTIVANNGALTFDELHVISDLHLGGPAGRQIFAGTAELTGLIEILRERPDGRRVALAINGDFVDFLAEEPAVHFDAGGATTKLDRIKGDPAFAPIWSALQRFVSTTNRYLVLILGNHDVELALPSVANHLVEGIAEGHDARRGRILLVSHGTGFAATVGGRRVICVHGNEADTWNVIDFDRVRRLATELQVEGTVSSWTPNAGTMLVIDVMNAIKARYPFVDLLKPETEAVVPILWALDQGTAQRLARCVKVAKRLIWDKARRAIGLLSGNDVESEATPDDLRALLVTASTDSVAADNADLLIERAMGQLHIDPLRVAPLRGDLGVAGAMWNRITNKSSEEIAFEAVRRLMSDRTFERKTQDAVFQKLDDQIGDADFIIAGHTHLERDLPRRRRRGRYLNTGTWARLIRLQPEWLRSSSTFAPLWNKLMSPSLAALDAAEIDGCPLVVRRHTVASVWEEHGQPLAALHRVRMRDGIAQLYEPTSTEE